MAQIIKTKEHKIYFLTLVLSACVFCLQAADLTNSIAIVQESWETISNRWGSVPLEKIKQSAGNGDVSAQYYLACAYEDGNGVPKDMVESFNWAKLAAQQGLARAQRYLGWKYQSGEGVETNLDEAIALYQKAILQGDAKAEFNLGWMYDSGIGVSTNYVEAARLYRLAAEQGHDQAQNNLGWLYGNGLGVPQDFDEALKWFKKSAAQGNSYAQNNLPWLAKKSFGFQYQMSKKYQKGDGVPKDASEAFKWMQKAAQSDAESMDALYELGLMYENGEGVKTNLSEAHNDIFGAAIGGQPDACFRVGQWYENGVGVPQDDYQATKYYFNAVFNLNGRKYQFQAAESLLKLYSEGRGLSKTNQEPEDYLDGELGDKKTLIQKLQYHISTAQAEFYVGRIYYQGTIVSQDLVEAAARFQVAADEGVDDAKKILIELDAKMSADQKVTAKKQAANFKDNLNMQKSMLQGLIQVYGW
jgi:TPR repeat protein